MKHLLTLLLIGTLLSQSLYADDDFPAYVIYNSQGKEVSFHKMMKSMDKVAVVLFGELHNNPICHWLQLQVTKQLHEKSAKKVILGAEMFEADDQLPLDEYLAGVISEKNFSDETKLWPNYKTDYKPLVEFAKEMSLKFVATNIPRRYASLVYNKGFDYLDSLSAEAKQYIATLPVVVDLELPGYKKILEMGAGHGGVNLPFAQAIKDATMAYFILKWLDINSIFIHFNGTYHSNNYEGIGWYLKQSEPDISISTIATVTQKDISKLDDENKGLADFIICVPDDMTTTH